MDAARCTLWIGGKALRNDAGRYCRRLIRGATRIGPFDVSVPLTSRASLKGVASRYGHTPVSQEDFQ
jgi:hypothetical protein